MNTHDIKLPQLPDIPAAICPWEHSKGVVKNMLEAYATAAIEADRKRFAELFMDLSRYAEGRHEQDNDLLLAGVSDGYWYAAESLLGNKGAVEELEADRQASGETTTRKAFICKSCEGVYADQPVSRCDCMPEKNEFIEGIIIYPKRVSGEGETKP